MADEEKSTTPASGPAGPGNGQSTGKEVLLQRIYVKDCSFELPRAPAVFDAPFNPEVKVDMRTDTNRLPDDAYEVVLSITVEASAENRSVFLAEVHQAGLFTIRGFSEQELGPVLGSYCPNILFPYARETISHLVQKGSMPPLLLQPVNFDLIYLQSIGQSPAAADTAGRA